MRYVGVMVRRIITCSVAAVMLSAGCAEDDGIERNDSPADVVYENNGTDEAWITLAEAGWDPVTANALTLTAPSAIRRDGEAPTFTWSQALASRVTRSAPESSFAWRFEDLFISRAKAHLPPVTGDIYRVDIEAGDKVIRVLTGATSYTPDEEAWATIKQASRVRVSLTYAYFLNGRITTGPFVAPIYSISVE
jgi:hypothetical protein